MTIYMLECAYRSEADWNYSEWESYGPDPDYGYFETQEAAQAKAEELNSFEEKYEQAKASVERDFEIELKQHGLKLVQWEAVEQFKKEHPDTPSGVFMPKPVQPKRRSLPKFEVWKKEIDRYEVVKIEKAS